MLILALYSTLFLRYLLNLSIEYMQKSLIKRSSNVIEFSISNDKGFSKYCRIVSIKKLYSSLHPNFLLLIEYKTLSMLGGQCKI
jgi:hypothetical protein